MILVTTSRKPAQRTRTFAKRLAYLIPGSQYVSRGKKGVADLAEEADAEGFRRACIVCERNGSPRELRFLDTDANWTEIKRIRDAVVEKERFHQDSINITGTKIKKAEKMFDLRSDEEGEITLKTGKTFEFIADGKRILSFILED